MATSRPDGKKLSAQKQALLAKLLQKKGMAAPAADQVIPRRRDSGPAPLSFAQEALWFLDQLEPDSSINNQPGAVRLQGQLDAPALERALAEIVARHESLRTTFTTREGRPFQVVAPVGEWRLPTIDLADRPRAEADAEALRRAAEDSHRPFDLERGPLFRAFLMRIADDEHILVLNMHHIVTDGWSMGVFTRELDALYRAFHEGRPSPLGEPAIQMADFAVWQREVLAGAALEEHRAYWRKMLQGGLSSVTLPADHPRPPVQSFRGRHHAIQLSGRLSDDLRGLSKRHGVTLFMTLNATFHVLLYDACRATDMVVGSAVAHRNRRELEGVIGFLVNMLALRTDLSGNPRFSELLQRVREVTIGAWSHQDLPITHILRELQPDRDLSRNPLFQVQFSLLTPDHNPAVYGYGLEMGEVETIELPGVTMTPVHVAQDNARYDIAVFLWDMPGGIQGTLEYGRELYEPATIARFVRRYEVLLREVVHRPDATLEDLVAVLEKSDRDSEKTFKSSARDKLKGLKRRRPGTPRGGA